MLYIFDHIPKTAGTTFTGGYLRTAFPRSVEVIPGNASEHSAALAVLAAAPIEDAGGLRIIAGHGADVLRAAAPRARYITLIREPIARLVSAHRHYLANPDAAEGQPVPEDFVAFALDPNRRDLQARTLLGEHYEDAEELSDQDIEAILADRYQLIGDSDRLAAFIFVLHRTCGFPLALFTDRLRRATPGPSLPRKDILSGIRNFHTVGRRLHRIANSMFDRALAEVLTPGGERELAIYTAALEAFADGVGYEPGRIWALPPEAPLQARADLAKLRTHDVWSPAEVRHISAGVEVTTGPTPWSFAAELALPTGSGEAGETYLQIDLRVRAGQIGLAICSAADWTPTAETVVSHAHEPMSVILPFEQGLERPALLVRNAAIEGRAGVAEVSRVVVFGQPAP